MAKHITSAELEEIASIPAKHHHALELMTAAFPRLIAEVQRLQQRCGLANELLNELVNMLEQPHSTTEEIHAIALVHENWWKQ